MDAIDAAYPTYLHGNLISFLQMLKKHLNHTFLLMKSKGGEGADAVCIVQWITAIIAPVDG